MYTNSNLHCEMDRCIIDKLPLYTDTRVPEGIADFLPAARFLFKPALAGLVVDDAWFVRRYFASINRQSSRRGLCAREAGRRTSCRIHARLHCQSVASDARSRKPRCHGRRRGVAAAAAAAVAADSREIGISPDARRRQFGLIYEAECGRADRPHVAKRPILFLSSTRVGAHRRTSVVRRAKIASREVAVMRRRSQLRFDFDSSAIRRPVDCATNSRPLDEITTEIDMCIFPSVKRSYW